MEALLGLATLTVMGDLGVARNFGLRTAQTACVAIVLSIFIGCGGSTSGAGGGEAGAGGGGGARGNPECTTSAQCEAPEVCEPFTQTCVSPGAPCTSQAECMGGTYCEATSNVCLPSSVGTPCAGPDNCNERVPQRLLWL